MTTIGEQNARKTLAFIKKCVDERGFPPSVREVKTELDRSLSTTHAIMNALVKNGLIEVYVFPTGQQVARSMKITQAGMEMIAADIEAL